MQKLVNLNINPCQPLSIVRSKVKKVHIQLQTMELFVQLKAVTLSTENQGHVGGLSPQP